MGQNGHLKKGWELVSIEPEDPNQTPGSPPYTREVLASLVGPCTLGFRGEEVSFRTLAREEKLTVHAVVRDDIKTCHDKTLCFASPAALGEVPTLQLPGPTLHKEMMLFDKLMKEPKRPFVAAIGGEGKNPLRATLRLMDSLLDVVDEIVVG